MAGLNYGDQIQQLLVSGPWQWSLRDVM